MMNDQIFNCLPQGHPWRGQLHWAVQTDSTNNWAKRLAADGAPHGTVVMAESQTGGRGRLGRSFHSPPGTGIYMSVILRPQCSPQAILHLTCAAAVAMCGAVEAAAGFRPGIKWTNDLVAGGRKLAGILTELGLDPVTGQVSYAVVGIGINCSQMAEDFPPELRDSACSLSMIAGRPVDRAALAAAMVAALAEMDKKLLTHKAETIAAYRRDCVTLGREVALCRENDTRHGRALDVDEDGGLIVEFPGGHRETIAFGEVSVRGMYGYL